MKRYILFLVFILITPEIGLSQKSWLDSIKHNWSIATHDTTRVLLLSEFSNYYKLKRPDSTLYYAHRALKLARDINFPRGEAGALLYISMAYTHLGNDSKALHVALLAKNISEKLNSHFTEAFILTVMGDIYRKLGLYNEALNLYSESQLIFASLNLLPEIAYSNNKIGETYLAMQLADSALYYSQKAYAEAKIVDSREDRGWYRWIHTYILLNLGNIQSMKGNDEQAMEYFKLSLSRAVESEAVFKSSYAISHQYQRMAMPDSSIVYAQQSLNIATESGFYGRIIEASLLLTSLYEKDNPQQALFYGKKAIAYNDSLDSLVKTSLQRTFIDFDTEERQRAIETARTEFQNRIKINAFLGSTFTLLVIAGFLYRSSRLKQQARQKIERAYEQLKATQTQLVQSEKMASLGELTAGIAHEIQNPVNFVNNFADVNCELIEELRESVAAGDHKETQTILNDLAENERKVRHHGRRAGEIVKAMLQHSRTSTGEKEPTDINALCDECLRLAYHGLQAKGNNINTDFRLDLDESLPKVNVVPQDMGRVLLNLFNNAFYAVTESSRLRIGRHPNHAIRGTQNDDYKPEVVVSTKRIGGNVEIRVLDNGDGVPEQLRDKIFQPFFTTKPTGQGTGLGLSLSYDIVTKGHGGQILVESESGRGTEFIIRLSVQEA